MVKSRLSVLDKEQIEECSSQCSNLVPVMALPNGPSSNPNIKALDLEQKSVDLDETQIKLSVKGLVLKESYLKTLKALIDHLRASPSYLKACTCFEGEFVYIPVSYEELSGNALELESVGGTPEVEVIKTTPINDPPRLDDMNICEHSPSIGLLQFCVKCGGLESELMMASVKTRGSTLNNSDCDPEVQLSKDTNQEKVPIERISPLASCLNLNLGEVTYGTCWGCLVNINPERCKRCVLNDTCGEQGICCLRPKDDSCKFFGEKE